MTLDVLPPSGQEAQPSPAYTELVEVLAHAIEKQSLDWPDEPRESQSSKLDERFLSGSGSRPTRRKLPFFPDLHHEVSRSWKQPLEAALLMRLTPLSISSGLLKRSQLRLSSSCRDVRVSQPLPRPPGNAQPPVRSQSVE